MGKVLAAIIGVLVLVAAVLVFMPPEAKDDTRAIRAYVESRGAAPVPRSWRGKIGKGI